MAIVNEIVAWDAVTLSKRIHQREISCVEVLDAYLEHINQLNPKVNAIVCNEPEDKLTDIARQYDRLLAQNQSMGLMHGFPQAPKDTMPAKGLITSKGSPIYRNEISTTDATIFARARENGSIFIGRTNTPEFGLGGNTVNTVYGPTLNPFDLSKTAGGSSGGAAVAVALHMLPVADGSDMMGSLRTPAAFNNVFGMRTSVGCVPHGPTEDIFFQQFSVSGPMARNVPDLALLLSVQAGFDPGLPLTRKQDDPTRYIAALERDFKSTKIAWLGDLQKRITVSSDVMESCKRALSHFETIDCPVYEESLHFDLAELWQAWIDLRSFTISGNNAANYRDSRIRPQLKSDVIWEIERGLALSAEQVFNATVVRSRFYRAVLGLFEDYDYLVLPTTQLCPFPVGELWPHFIENTEMDTYHRWMEISLVATMAGLPSLSVPAGFNSSGLPVGLQIIGPPQADLEVLQLGYAYDKASQFSTIKSPLLKK